MSLRLRLALFGTGVVALTLLIFGVLLYALLARGVSNNQDDALRTRAQAAARALGGTNVQPEPMIAPADLATSTDVYVEVVYSDGSVAYSTAQLHGQPPPVPAGLLDQAALRRGAFATEGDPGQGTQVRVYAMPFPGGYVLAGQSTRVPASNLSGILVFLVISAIPALLAAMLASWLVAGRALRPLRVVAHTADEIAGSRDFGRRLAAGRERDEVGLLTASFNRMLEALQDAYAKVASALESQRRFVADASHELRTPLTTIQGNAGLLAHGPDVADSVRRAAAADIAGESERMARLTDRLLTLARADAGLELALAPTALRPLVEEVTRQAGAVHPGVHFTVDAADLSVEGDQDALRQLLWNLLDNATRHARSAIEVSLHENAGWARLMVGDDGAGVPAAERERIFERFYKVDAARASNGAKGAGLGLAIARWITEQHRGRIIAVEGPAGGAGFFVDLPLLSRS
jgi:signal transduction histidine kinase